MKIFKNEYNYKTNEKYQKALKNINDFTQVGIDFVEAIDLSEAIYLHEQCAISLRAKLENIEEDIELGHETKKGMRNYDLKKEKLSLKNLPVSLEQKGKIYHIKTPYTFKRGMRVAFELCTYLKAELVKKTEEGMTIELNEKYVVSAIRVSKEFIHSQIKDNDNLETSRMINIIFGDFLGRSDNAKNMSFFSDYLISDDENEWGFHLFLVPYEYGEFRGRPLLNLFKK